MSYVKNKDGKKHIFPIGKKHILTIPVLVIPVLFLMVSVFFFGIKGFIIAGAICLSLLVLILIIGFFVGAVEEAKKLLKEDRERI